jgi:phospholipase/carboxylesterase
MPLETIEKQTGPDPRATMLVLHGLGADGHDFVPFCDELELAAVGPMRFVFPHAPIRPVTINGGYRMRAWYDILGTETQRREDEAGLRQSLQSVEALLAREKERGIPASRIVLAGFSQGCAMALLTGLRHSERLAGIVGMSGYLPLRDKTEAERSPANADLPIFMGHGQFDPMIEIARAQVARDALAALGHPVSWHEYPMAHSVCAQEISDINAWLLQTLA